MKWRGLFGGGAASGKAGALVASRAKSTQYVRARVTPVNPNSPQQQAVRNAVKYLSGLWQRLTSSQRESWNSYAAIVTVVNSLGDASKLSGFNWFNGNNTVRKQCGFTEILQGPAIYDLGNPDVAALGLIFTTSAGATRGTLTLASALTLANPTNGFMAVYCSRPYSPGKNFFKGPYQLAAVHGGNLSIGTYSFDLPFAAAGVGAGDTQNQMEVVLRFDQGDGRLSSKFQRLNQ